MEEREILEKIKESFPEADLEIVDENTDHPYLKVPVDTLLDVCRKLKDDPELDMQTLTSLSGVDYGENLTTVYHLFSYEHRHFCVLKVDCLREDPRVPSVEPVWPGAGWFEREAYDLLGITYEGNSDLRRIMLPEDWEGHPLRKDYVEPEEYHGMGTGRTDALEITWEAEADKGE